MLLLLACTGSTDTDKTDTDVTDSSSTHACNTDNEDCGPGSCGGEGSRMLPGANCMECHAVGSGADEAPPWTIAGTVFADRWGTDGQNGAVLTITGDNGDTLTLTSNDVGNFYSAEPLVGPYTASITVDGETREMSGAVDTGACSSCHSCEGEAGGKLY